MHLSWRQKLTNVGMKCIIRDKAQEGEQNEMVFDETETKAEMASREYGCGHPPSEEECSKEVLKSFIQFSSSGFVFLRASYLILPHHSPYVDVQAPFSQDGSPSDGF